MASAKTLDAAKVDRENRAAVRAVEGVVDAIWFNQGQVCCAGSRLLMQESIAETLTARIKERMGRLVIGDSLDKGVDIGIAKLADHGGEFGDGAVAAGEPEKLPVSRIGEPADVAQLALFLASDESAYCSGTDFVIDGGATA